MIEISHKVERLKLLNPTEPANRKEIFQLMDETRTLRRKDMQQKDNEEPWTLHSLLNLYPRFLDFDGEIVRSLNF